MKLTKKYKVMATIALGGFILCSPAYAQDWEDDEEPPVKLRIHLPKPNPYEVVEPRTSRGWSKTPDGYPIERFSDGTSIELRPECKIETLCDGTKIETLPSGTQIVRWPAGGGAVRYPDGTGSLFRPDPTHPSKDGDPTPIPGTVEVLPDGVVRQRIKDEDVVFDRYPNGTTRSRPDLVKPETKTMDQPVNKNVNVAPLNPFSRSFEKKSESPKALIPFVRPSIVK